MKYSKARSVLAYSFAFFAAAFVLAALFALEGRYPGLAKYNYCFAAAGAAVVLFLLILFLVYFVSTKKEAVRLVTTLSDSLDPLKKESVENFPLALAVTDSTGEIEWYNGLFRENIIAGRSSDIKYLGDLIGENAQKLIKENGGNALCDEKEYTVYLSSVERDGEKHFVFYFADDTDLKKISREYESSRPVVLFIAIDGAEESGRGYKNSDIAEIRTAIERIIEDWSLGFDCLMKNIGTDRYMLITQLRYLDIMSKNRFSILDTVRSYKYGGADAGITLSIGVGQGESLSECETNARQSLDMCFGRGGDQAAVRNTDDSYTFFGGVSQSIEKRTKVKSRIAAKTIKDLVNDASNVVIMGHRFPDMDAFGSAVALCSAINTLGVEAKCVMEKSKSLAIPIYDRLVQEKRADMVIEPVEGIKKTGKDTLLIVVDTHIKDFVEVPEIYAQAGRVIVIDHHRKAVNYIDNAVVFYHDPVASSAAEMVTELLQYMSSTPIIGKLEADALLAGIMLDTKNFVLRAGVRTFEAAAYLKERGADTVRVKMMFDTSIENYKLRNKIISNAEKFKNCAISVADFTSGDARIICSQAADELLNIRAVDASFVLYENAGVINISARSLGAVNVQLIMEKLGGGGHRTMAAAQFKDRLMNDIVVELKAAIEEMSD